MKSKEDFITTALRLFRTMPYNDVSISRICAEVGVTKGSFFHHFDNKEELFRLCAERFDNDSPIDLEGRPNPQSLWELCMAYCDAFWSPGEELLDTLGGDLFFLQEAFRRIPSFAETHRENMNRDVMRWVSAIDRAKANGEIASPLPSADIARLFLSVEDSILLDCFISSLPAPLARRHMEARFRTIYQPLQP